MNFLQKLFKKEKAKEKVKEIETPDFGMAATLSGLKKRGNLPEVVFDIGAADGQLDAPCIICIGLIQPMLALNRLPKDRNPGCTLRSSQSLSMNKFLLRPVVSGMWTGNFLWG